MRLGPISEDQQRKLYIIDMMATWFGKYFGRQAQAVVLENDNDDEGEKA